MTDEGAPADGGPRDRGETEPSVVVFDDALGVLGGETRLRILLALAAEANERGMGAGLSFSTLRERVGVRDSGRFNYHLGELRGEFVLKDGDEYVARFPGLAVAAAMYAGTYRDTELSGEAVTETGFRCPREGCSRTAEAQYGSDGLLSGVWMECPEHGRFDRYPVPPGAREGRTLEELVETAYRRAHTNINLGRQGICLECWGSVSVTFPSDPGEGQESPDRFLWTELSCERCWNQLSPPLRNVLVTHPLVIGLFYEHDAGPLAAARELTGPGDDVVCETELIERDPPTARVRIEVGDDTLSMTVDENCAVVDHERTSG